MTPDIVVNAFVDGTDLPTRSELRSASSLGASGRDLIEALIDRDHDHVAALLAGDPALAGAHAGGRTIVEIAVATGDVALIDLVIARGAPIDGQIDGRAGDGAPLVLALHARDPRFAHALLTAGAKAVPPGDPTAAFDAAIALGSASGVKMLLDFGGDPNARGALDRRPLHIALDMERFRIAEMLIDAGADLWAVDSGGANLGTAVTTPMVTQDRNERAAQIRLSTRAVLAGWPDPAPTPVEIKEAVSAGRWPPPPAS